MPEETGKMLELHAGTVACMICPGSPRSATRACDSDPL